MNTIIEHEIIELFKETNTKKVLITSNEKGESFPLINPFIEIYENGNLVYLEFLQTTTTHKNLTRSVWFDRDVVVAIRQKDVEVQVIKAKPIQVIICGEIFKKYCEDIQERVGDLELAAVWIIKPI